MFSIKASSGPTLNIWLIVSAKKQPQTRGGNVRISQGCRALQGYGSQDPSALRLRQIPTSAQEPNFSELLQKGSNVWAAHGVAPRGLSCAVPFAMDGLSLHYSPDKQWLKLYRPVHVPPVR